MTRKPCEYGDDHRELIARMVWAMQPRLDHARDTIEAMTPERRIVVCRWIRETLERNRVAFAGPAWRDIRDVLVALRNDMLWETASRDSVVLPNGSIVAEPISDAA